MSARPVLTLPAHALETRAPAPAPALHTRLEDHLAVRFEGVLTRNECAAYARGVYAGRGAWIPNFDGVQFTLGRAWYVHLETDREDEYFAGAVASDAAVERFVPGLADRLLTMMRLFLGGDIERREGWCGPGVHVFPAGEWVSKHGGDIHFDCEGLGETELATHADAVTVVLMLQPAAQGGGLRVWDKLHEDEDSDEDPEEAASEVITYGAGDLVILDSYRLHQICASSGPLDRISATAHAVRGEKGWEAWF